MTINTVQASIVCYALSIIWFFFFQMGRTKTTARKKGAISAEQMQQAINMHLNCHMSVRKVAKEFQIPYQTLQRYAVKAIQGTLIRLEPNYSVKKVFTHEQET